MSLTAKPRRHAEIAVWCGAISLVGTAIVAAIAIEIIVVAEITSPAYLAILGISVVTMVTLSIYCIALRRSTIAAKLGIAIVMLWALWLVIEVGFHIYAATQPDLARIEKQGPEITRYTPHPYVAYGLTRGWTSPEERSRYNSLGYRGSQPKTNREPGTLRVLLLGGSTTYGGGVASDVDTWASLLQGILQQHHPDLKPEVINGGVPGYSSTESLINLSIRGIDLKPDIAILYHGCNDAHFRFVRPHRYVGEATGYRRAWDSRKAAIWTKTYESFGLRVSAALRWVMVRWAGRKYTPTNIGVEWVTVVPGHFAATGTDDIPGEPYDRVDLARLNPPVYFERNLRSFVAVCRAHRIRPVLVTWMYGQFVYDYMATDSYRLAIKQQNDVVLKLSRELSVPLIDLASDGLDKNESYWVENRHMTREGNAEKADATYAALVELGLIPGRSNQAEN